MHGSELYHPTWDVLDSSKLGLYMLCPRKFFYRYMLGWSNEGNSIHLVFGDAWHQALAAFYEGKSVDECYTKYFLPRFREEFPPDMDLQVGAKSPDRAKEGLEAYAQRYRHDEFKVVAVEVAGSVPVSPDTNMQFRLDLVVQDAQNRYMIVEHKTSGTYRKDLWENQWVLSNQVNLYLHALKAYYHDSEVYGAIVNGTFFYKTKIEFLRTPVRPPNKHVRAWLWDLNYWITALKEERAFLNAATSADDVLTCFPRNPGACTQFSTCEFHDMCVAWQNPLAELHRKPDEIQVKWWDPRDYEKTARVVLHSDKETENATGNSATGTVEKEGEPF